MDHEEAELKAADLAGMRDRVKGIELMTEQRACGYLDVSRQVLLKSGIPRVQIVPGVIRYRVSDIEAFIAENLEHTR